jgi:hypothetical protein
VVTLAPLPAFLLAPADFLQPQSAPGHRGWAVFISV